MAIATWQSVDCRKCLAVLLTHCFVSMLAPVGSFAQSVMAKDAGVCGGCVELVCAL